MLIDFHTHGFPDSLAEKAIPKLAAIGKLEPFGSGKISNLLENMDKDGVDRAVLLNIATNPHQQTKVNDFAIQAGSHPRIYSLGSLNPDADNIASEARRLADAGIRGIKLHPDYMEHPIDDPLYDAVFKACVENDLFVVSHSGWDFISPDFIHCTPERIVKVLDKYPSLRFIGAHMGANKLWDDVERLLVGRRNFWFDTSLAPAFELDKAQAKRMIENHDPEKILFGSDFPWFTAKTTYDYVASLGLSQELLARISYKNAIALLGDK